MTISPICQKVFKGFFLSKKLFTEFVIINVHIRSFAGSETVATALRAAVLYIASNPLVVDRMRTEMEIAGISRDRPTKTIISYAQARKIPYLTAVVREVLRMHPPAIGALEKQVDKGGDVVPDGRHVPAGTRFYTSIWATLRDPEVFGPDAELFRPERWLEVVEPEKKRLMDRSADLVFGAGRYLCLGREIAMMQCLKVISEVNFAFPSYFSILVLAPCSILPTPSIFLHA